MSKETLKGLIDLIDDADMETIFRVLVRFIPEDKPMPDEVEAIRKANKSIAENGTDFVASRHAFGNSLNI